MHIISCEFLHSVLLCMWTARNSLDTQTTSWHKLPHPTEEFVCGGSYLNFVLKLCWTPWERVNTKIQNACLLVLPVGLLFYKHWPTIQPKQKITLSQQTYKLIFPSQLLHQSAVLFMYSEILAVYCCIVCLMIRAYCIMCWLLKYWTMIHYAVILILLGIN